MTKGSIRQEELNIIYTFLNYEVIPSLREIKQFDTALKSSKKSFDILLLLIEKQGQIVSKKELIEQVWPNQIVTDATLNKQITRLRNDLVAVNPSDQVIIETVRGVGIRLVPPVKSRRINNNKFKLGLLIAFLLIASLLYVILGPVFKTHDVVSSQVESNTSVDSYNIVLVPSEKPGDWLNVGGLEYLAQKLQQHQEFNITNPNHNWFENEDSQAIAIDMAQNEGVDYVLVAQNKVKDDIYMANLALRNRDGILAKEAVESDSISGLFDKIDSWVARQLQIKATIESKHMYSYKTTDYVLESYLRGREVAIHASYSQASQLLQTATSQDTNFIPAWIALAEVEARLGNNDKALALIETVANREDLTPQTSNSLLVRKTNFLVGVNKLDEALKLLDQAIDQSEILDDIPTLIDAITIKIKIFFNSGSINQATIDLSLRQISLLGEYRPDPYLLALAYYNLTTSYHQLGQTELAIQSIEKSIGLFDKANNIRGVVTGTSLLARIFKDMGDTSRALLTLERIEGLPEKIDGVDEQQIYWQYKAENQIYHGLKDDALFSIEKLKLLSQNSTSIETKIIALSLSFELNLIHKQYDQAKINVNQMMTMSQNIKQVYPPIYNDLISVYDMLITAKADTPSSARIKVEKNLKSNPNIKIYFANELKMIETNILVKENNKQLAIQQLSELLETYMAINKRQDALYYAGYPLLDLQWDMDQEAYVKTMNYLDNIALFKYPINKYKAQHLARNNNFINAYAMMVDLKSKANQFWTTQDQLLLEKYQELSQSH